MCTLIERLKLSTSHGGSVQCAAGKEVRLHMCYFVQRDPFRSLHWPPFFKGQVRKDIFPLGFCGSLRWDSAITVFSASCARSHLISKLYRFRLLITAAFHYVFSASSAHSHFISQLHWLNMLITAAFHFVFSASCAHSHLISKIYQWSMLITVAFH